MFTVSKRLEISAAHYLNLSYPSPCSSMHGHNWIFNVWCRSEELDNNGMVIDFKHIKETVNGAFDHTCINEKVCQPTAENIAKHVKEMLGSICFKVEVWESEGNYACYET